MNATESAALDAKTHMFREYASAAAGWQRWRQRFAVAGRAATAALVQEARPAAGMRVLDLASGTGEPALPLAGIVGPGGRVVATDLTPPMLRAARDEARARGIDNLSFAMADAETLPFADGSFDLVTCRFAVMHFPYAERAMWEAWRVLRPGGRAAFSALGAPEQTPALMCTVGVVLQYTPAAPAVPPGPGPALPHPYRFAAPDALVAVMRGAGFRDVSEFRPLAPAPWPGPPEEFWESMPEQAPEFAALLARLAPDRREAATAAALAALARFYDGNQLNFVQPLVVASGTR
jgi:ubiquinone/menaquinone biosynthesis C-methylase UbiE